MLPHKIQIASFIAFGISFLVLFVVLVCRLGEFIDFGGVDKTLIIVFVIIEYVSLLTSVISKEKKENETVRALRFKVATYVSLTYLLIVLIYNIVNVLFIGNDPEEILPVKDLYSGSTILIFIVAYIVILKVLVKKKTAE